MRSFMWIFRFVREDGIIIFLKIKFGVGLFGSFVESRFESGFVV